MFCTPDGLVPKRIRNSKSFGDDIPIAARELPQSRNRRISWLQLGLILFLTSTLLTIGLTLGWSRWQSAQSSRDLVAETEVEPESEPDEPVDNILGHLPYDEVDVEELTAVTQDGRIQLQDKAAERFSAMVADARAAGISLAALSGYRTVEEQEYLFFEVKAQRNQDASKRAEVSAPPGFSEHHTGYAIDIGDANQPQTHLLESFEETPAFAWLDDNAARYSFELSFPRNNVQGIAYEPWHWRFVGDRDSLETFYRAQNLPSEGEREIPDSEND